MLEYLKLIYLWFSRILLAKNHFRLPLWKKLWLNLHGYLVDQAALYDFDHCDRGEFLSEFDWYRSRQINGDYRYALNNKVIWSDLIKPYAKVPEIYAVKRKRYVIGEDGGLISPSELMALIRAKGRCIVKPVCAGKGTGVLLVEFRQGTFFVDRGEIDCGGLEEILRKKKDWYLSQYIDQAEYLNQIFPETANTIRIITLRSPESGKLKLFFAVQRIGTSKTVPVDNGSQGGLIARIDLISGELTAAKSLHCLDVYETHPDTGAPIRGVKIPHWRELSSEVLALAGRFSYLDFIAWDILPTDDGFYIIEANASSGVNIIQIWGGQRRGELGDFYRFHGVIK